MPGVVVLVVAYACGSIPFANWVARRAAGVDLRATGSGTVSGSALYEVAGFRPLALAGVFEVAKGAVGPFLAGPDRPALAALAGGLAVVGHDWSPFLRGAGGRGVSPATGALLVQTWPSGFVMLGGLLIGRVFHQSGVGTFVGMVLVVPVAAATHGAPGALAAACVLLPVVVKRLVGNRPPPRHDARAYLTRLVHDRDDRPAGA